MCENNYISELKRLARLKKDFNWAIVYSKYDYSEEEREILTAAADILDR